MTINRKFTERFYPFAFVPLRETEKAYKVLLNGEEFWIPKSQLRNERFEGEELTGELPEWLAKEKGLV